LSESAGVAEADAAQGVAAVAPYTLVFSEVVSHGSVEAEIHAPPQARNAVEKAPHCWDSGASSYPQQGAAAVHAAAARPGVHVRVSLSALEVESVHGGAYAQLVHESVIFAKLKARQEGGQDAL